MTVASPAPGSSQGHESLPQEGGTGSLPAALGPGLVTRAGSQPQRKHVDTRARR